MQGQSSNHRTLRGDEIPGGEQSWKRRRHLRQVWIRETNVSEPLMRRRKDIDAIEIRPHVQAWDEARREPVYGPGDGRRRGGVNLIQAFAWNVGTEHPDVKGEVRGVVPRRASVPMRDAGADRFVVATKPGNAGGAKGPDRPVSGMDQPYVRSSATQALAGERGGVHG